MERTFKTLFDLTMKHDFYDNEKSNDFLFVPVGSTAQDMKNFKLLARTAKSDPGQPQANGLTVSYSDVNNSPHIPITGSSAPSLKFGLQLRNTEFFNYTTEVALLSGDEFFHYTNVGASEVLGVIELVRSVLKLRRRVFPHVFSVADPLPVTATIKVYNADNIELVEFGQTLVSEDGNFDSLIDLSEASDGIYTVKIISNAIVVQEDKFYVSDELTAMRAFGLIDISVVNNTDLSTKELRVSFTTRETKWKYFVVFAVPLANSDTIKLEQPSPSTLKFSEIAAAAGDLVTKESLESQNPGSDVRLYESDILVEYKESVPKNIKLKKNGEVLVLHMPAPSLSNVKPEAYIFI